MASFGRSFKPTSYLSSMGRRPGMPGRSISNLSNTSEPGSGSSSPGDVNVEDIIYSGKPSPTYEGSPRSSPARKAGDGLLKPPDTPRSLCSRPIAIEIPTAKKSKPTSSQTVYTPPAPLSARGDLPGGYFPNHEDQDRVYRSHPFHLDASKARQNSIQRASQPTSSDSRPSPPSPTVVDGHDEPPATAPLPLPTLKLPLAMARRDAGAAAPPNSTNHSSTTTQANTPVAGYIPSGAHATPLPMGKYYPSNYESRKAQKRLDQQRTRPPTSATIAGGAKSDTQIPTLRGEPSMGHARNESEARRRLQQYQRDMIAQATLALSGGNVNTAALNAISVRNMGFSSISGNPTKPRLEPLGSPGPVTPIDLADSSDEGYLGARVIRSPGGVGGQADEIARAIRADQERRRREGAISPAVELSPGYI